MNQGIIDLLVRERDASEKIAKVAESKLESALERAEKAEACCSEMRECLNMWYPDSDRLMEKKKHALSSDCGKEKA